jgi:hypothetical protein
VQNTNEASITFIMERMFVKDCIKFLCREARIEDKPVSENSFLVYNVPHQCYYSNPPTNKAPPPPYSENTPPPITPDSALEHDYDVVEFIEEHTSSSHGGQDSDNAGNPQKQMKTMRPVFQFPDGVWGDYSSGSGSDKQFSLPSVTPLNESVIPSNKIPASNDQDFSELPPRTILRQNDTVPLIQAPSSVMQTHNSTTDGKLNLETPYQSTKNGALLIHPRQQQVSTALLLRKCIPLPPRNTVGGEKEGVAFKEAGAVPSGNVVEAKRGTTRDKESEASWAQVGTHRYREAGDVTTEGSRKRVFTASLPDQLHPPSHTHNTLIGGEYGSHNERHPKASRRSLAMTPPLSFSCAVNNSWSHLRDRGQRGLSYTSHSHVNQSPTNGYDGDCYVLVTPHLSSRSRFSSTSSSSSLSPSYIRESQLLAMEQERNGSQRAHNFHSAEDGTHSNDVFDESNSSSPLSLADAGDVIRHDWMESLKQQRLSQERSDSESLLSFSDTMSLDEVAYLEYRKNCRSSRPSCGDYVDEGAFVISPHSRYDGTHWSIGSSSDEEERDESLLVDFDGRQLKLPPNNSRAQQPVPSSTIAKPHPHADSAVVVRHRQEGQSFSYHRPRSQHVNKKPEIRPRRKGRNAVSVGVFNSHTSAQFHSNVSFEFHSSLRKLSPEECGTGKSHMHCSADLDYVHSSVPTPVQRKPVPAPRTTSTLGVKSSAQASMVTLGMMQQWSSSEGNLLDVFNEGNSATSELYWEQTLYRSHSSTEINN